MYKNKLSIKQGLNIIIVGCGKVGATLVEQLVKEQHDITIIDKNYNVIQSITDMYDVMGLAGNGASYSVQMEAGIQKADLIIAVTDSDELNLLCCTMAKRVGNCAAIARVRTPDYVGDVGFIREQLGLAMIINPELEAAKVASRILFLPTALQVNSFAHGQAEMIRFKIPEGNFLDGITVAHLGHTIAASILICAVERGEEITIPSGNFRLQQGDVVSVVAARKAVKEFLEDIGFKTKRVKNTLIIGGGNAAVYLARLLQSYGVYVKIIEKDPARCEELSILLPKAVIINGDGTDQDLLIEEGIESAESFVPLTGIDEENVMLSLFAKQISEAKLITKIDRMNFRNVISSLDLGSVIYPRYITSEAIIAYVRARTASIDSNIETLYHVFDNRAETIEFLVTENSKVTDTPLSQLSLKPGLLLSFINRRGNIIIPSGQDYIQKGDTVMVVTTQTGLTDIADILA